MTSDRPKLLILAKPPDFWCDKLADIRPLVEIEVAETPDQAEDKVADADIVFGWEEGQAWLERCWHRAGKLRWVQCGSAGLERMLFPALAESSIPLTNGRGLYARALAEFVLFCTLYFARQGPAMEQNRRERRWGKYESSELLGQTMGIVGLGGTGRLTARLANAFGMKVLATKRNPTAGVDPEIVDLVVPLERWHELLAASDYVVNALPLTPETRGLFGEPEFRAMKTSGCFINVGRGKTVQEQVLVQALREGWIASAGLDVFETEPLPADSELYTLPNVIVSPHCADQTASYYEESARLLCENVRRYVNGESLLNLVDKRLRY